jgi:hypothetical protein
VEVKATQSSSPRVGQEIEVKLQGTEAVEVASFRASTLGTKVSFIQA